MTLDLFGLRRLPIDTFAQVFQYLPFANLSTSNYPPPILRHLDGRVGKRQESNNAGSPESNATILAVKQPFQCKATCLDTRQAAANVSLALLDPASDEPVILVRAELRCTTMSAAKQDIQRLQSQAYN
jgi:hypothetical protein